MKDKKEAPKKAAAPAGGILHPEMKVETGTYDAPAATIGSKPDQMRLSRVPTALSYRANMRDSTRLSVDRNLLCRASFRGHRTSPDERGEQCGQGSEGCFRLHRSLLEGFPPNRQAANCPYSQAKSAQSQAGKWRFVRPAPLAAQLVLGRPPCRRNPAATLEGFERARMGAIGRGVGGRSFSLTLPTGYRIILSALKKALVRQCSAIAQR